MANVLGINLSELTRAGALKKISGWLNNEATDGNNKTQHYIVTPNPEIILASHKDEELFYILNKADMAIADGFGLKLAGLLNGEKIPRLTGADLTLELLSLAQERKLKVAILNWRGGLSRKTEIKAALNRKYPNLEFLVIDESRSHPLSSETIRSLNEFAPAILFVAFGSPYQEKTIYHNLKKIRSLKVAIGVGGSFDFITGAAVRAPKFLRQIGLEWLWRLLKPNKVNGKSKLKRWKRIYTATIVFTSRLLRGRVNHFFYRPNVACLLYKKENGKIKILIVEREDDPGHWQLPQGGTDGESLEKAGAREAREELNTSAFIPKATFKNAYSYLFPPVSDQRILSTKHNYKYDYKGQKQGLFIAEFIGKDEDIKVNFWDHRAWKWVDMNDLIESVFSYRQDATRIFLEKFKSLSL